MGHPEEFTTQDAEKHGEKREGLRTSPCKAL
jgi:hypothetical protein